MKIQHIRSANFNCFCTFLLLLLFPLISSAQSFNIKGSFIGENTKELVLLYYNEFGDPVLDTLQIQNGKFATTGTIGGVQQVFLKGKTESNSMEDPNFGFFFLEPGDLKISLQEDKFQQMKVEGSPTQLEWKKIDKEQAVIRKEMDAISQKLSSLATKPESNNEEKKEAGRS